MLRREKDQQEVQEDMEVREDMEEDQEDMEVLVVEQEEDSETEVVIIIETLETQLSSLAKMIRMPKKDQSEGSLERKSNSDR